MELRSAIEVQAAAGGRTGDGRRDHGAHRRPEAAGRRHVSYTEALEIGFRFHRRLIEIAGNPLMRNLMEVTYEFMLTQMARTSLARRQPARPPAAPRVLKESASTIPTVPSGRCGSTCKRSWNASGEGAAS